MSAILPAGDPDEVAQYLDRQDNNNMTLLARYGKYLTVRRVSTGEVRFTSDHGSPEAAALAYANWAVGRDDDLAPQSGDVVWIAREGTYQITALESGSSVTGWTVRVDGRYRPLRLWGNFRWITRAVS